MRPHVLSIGLLLVLAGVPRATLGQLSPGPLAGAHRELDGPLQCFQCHVRGKPAGGMDRRCLDCHREIDVMRFGNRGLHAGVADARCASCHPEHGGRAFEMVVWKEGAPERFDHRRSGWPLQGKHARLECRTCHRATLQRSRAAGLMRRANPGSSWLGLETACASCHADPHRGQLGPRCESCHDARAWSPAPGFDHQRTGYPLTGAHADVACARCHATPTVATTRDRRGRPVPRWKPLPHGECGACHRDPHAGRFGEACARCHETTSFRAIDTERFDHERTRYPLRGAHVRVGCERCHDPAKAGGAKPRFDRCDACHGDPHAGLATLNAAATDCASCHDVHAFRPSAFTSERHQRTAYPLEGRHARADCALCHVQVEAADPAAAALGRARVRLRPKHERCADCHQDPHGFDSTPRTAVRPAARAAPPAGSRRRAASRDEDPCRACHDPSGFRPSSVGVAAHARYAFPLEGAHRAVLCEACHEQLRGRPRGSTLLAAVRPLRSLTFRNDGRACADCHRSPHGDQFRARDDGGACQSCHGLDTFAPATAFDHDRDAAFRLEGAHARAACARCHPSSRDPSGRARVIYRPLSTQCRSCYDREVRHDPR